MKPQISKDTFCKAIDGLANFVSHLSFVEYSVSEALEIPQETVWANCRESLLDPLIQSLSEAMGDSEKLLDDFIYEPPSPKDEFDLSVSLHCGKEAVIHYKNWGDLYDYLLLRAAQEDNGTEAHELRKQLCQSHGISCC